jgi:translation initiation factor IF-3
MGKEYSVNSHIKAHKVNLILLDGSMKESVQLFEALKIGEEEGLDVVEVSQSGKHGLPTCKLLDYGKLMYDQSKKKKGNKKQIQHVKEIKFGFNIDPHDLCIRHKKITKFLTKKYVVKYILELSGREKSRINSALEMYDNNIEEFKELATWKKPQVSYGKRILISATLMPI